MVLYFAGHGLTVKDKWYFVPYELSYPKKDEEVIAKGISSDELNTLMKSINAQKVLFLIDACKSGIAMIAFRSLEERRILFRLSRASGIHIVTASNQDQLAGEVKELRHDVFTYTIPQGLDGKAKSASGGVTVRSLITYIEDKLPDFTKKYKSEAQYPLVDSNGINFPLTK